MAAILSTLVCKPNFSFLYSNSFFGNIQLHPTLFHQAKTSCGFNFKRHEQHDPSNSWSYPTGSRVSKNSAYGPSLIAAAALYSESADENSDSSLENEKEIKLDLNLPRRRLQVSFTCDACGVRSERLINPHAYARGTVFVQCAGCEVYHKLIDNLGLIEEYDFREESKMDENEENQ